MKTAIPEETNLKPINDYMKRNGISKTTFCNLCKMSIRSFDKIMSNNHFFQ